MNSSKQEKWMAHCDAHFGQRVRTILHPTIPAKLHVDVLVNEPTERFPFWKLVTMGAGDYKMPAPPDSRVRQSEYVMFVAAEEDLNDRAVWGWYQEKLMKVALFACVNRTWISISHSFEWTNDDPADPMVGAFIVLPQIIQDASIIECRLGMLETVHCMQVVLLTRRELDRLKEMGRHAFYDWLYPPEGGRVHFLTERVRTENF